MKIRYYGHAGQHTGYGVAAGHMIRALLAVGVEVEIRTLAPYDGIREALAADDALHVRPGEWTRLPLASRLKFDGELDPKPDAVIVHTTPADAPKVLDVLTKEGTLVENTPHVCYTTWEYASPVPDDIATALNDVFDEVWVPSTWCDRFEMEDTGVRIIPHAYDPSIDRTARIDFKNASPDTFKFYYVGAWNSRKNPAGVIRAFAHVFDRSDPVELLLHMPGADRESIVSAFAVTGLSPDTIPVIRAENRLCSQGHVDALHQGADCFVTATRGEGWNLPAFDAMLAGRNIIAPQGHGHAAFLGNTSARTYMAYPMPAADDVVRRPHPQDPTKQVLQPFGVRGASSKSLWLEPDLLQLAEAMEVVFQSRRRTLEARPESAFPGVAERFGYEAVGALALRALEALLR